MTELLKRCQEIGANRGLALRAAGWDVKAVAASLEEVAELGATTGTEYAIFSFVAISHIPHLLDDLRLIAAGLPDVSDTDVDTLKHVAEEAWRAYARGLLATPNRHGNRRPVVVDQGRTG